MATESGSEIGEAGAIPSSSIAAPNRAERRIITVALLLAMAVAALEQTVVSTAMPTIIARLKGLEIYPWVFSAYLLASTVSTPLYGKLADLFGRKRMLLFGLTLFSLGSILSGLAESMPMLIAMRVIQGLGAGAIGPIVLTIMGDLYSMEDRAKVQGLFSGVWGASSLIGPALGGVLTDNLSWRWVFFVTVPFSLVAAWVLLRHVREPSRPRSFLSIDWPGAALLAGGSTSLLLAALGGADRSRAAVLGLLGLAGVLLVLLVRQERRAADPVLPLDLVARPTIAAAILGSFALGALLFGLDTYVPLYIQGVLGGTATAAGRALTPLFLAWSISVAVAARVVVRFGFRKTALAGTILIGAGALALAVASADPGWAGPAFPVAMIVIGLGMGPSMLCYLLGVQNSVDRDRRGAATGAVIFSRTIGGALGVGVLGAILGLALARNLAGASLVGIDVAAALRPETHSRLDPAQLRAVRESLGRALHLVFLQMAGLAGLGLICSTRLAGGRAVEKPGVAEVEEIALASIEV